MTNPFPPVAPRTLHLIDLENLAGAATVSESAALLAGESYRDSAEYVPGDLVVVASSHRNGFAARLAFPGSTVRWRSGRHGADLALLDAVREFDLSRFDRIVIGSGDGIFATLARAARSGGIEVVVVSRRRALAASLRSAAHVIALQGEAA
jgi:hypothetical protein